MKALVGIFAASVMLVSGSVVAAEDSGWYVGAGASATRFKGDDSFSETGYGAVGIGGFQVNKYLAWEGQIQYSGKADGDIEVGGVTGAASAKYTYVAAGILGNIPIGNFGIFGRALASSGKLTTNASYAGMSERTSSRDLGYILGVGTSAQFGSIGVRLRYDFNVVSFNDNSGIDNPESLTVDVLWRF